MIIAHHAPPPNSHTGVADYAVALERALSGIVTIGRVRAKADIDLYHLGNNRVHEEIYRRAIEIPGAIVLHDAVLHHFMLGTLSEREYLDEFAYNFGEWRRDVAGELWRDRAAAHIDPRYFRYPMLRRVVARSRAVIVHNAGAAALVKAAAPDPPPVFVVPHLHITGPVGDGHAVRQRVGLDSHTTLFGIFGYLREPKRIGSCIAAFRRLHAVRPDTVLLIAGETASRDLAQLLELEAVHPAIRRVERLNERDFTAAIAAVDCCVNLRYPGAGETSGIAIHAMAAAKPVILSDLPEASDYPPEACLRVTPGPSEVAELFDCMSIIREFPRLVREIGIAAQSHVRTSHAPDRVARMYVDALETVVAGTSAPG